MNSYTANKQKISRKLNQVSRDLAQRSVRRVKGSVKGSMDLMTEKVKSVTDSSFDVAINYIKTHPIQSVLGALALGYTLGVASKSVLGSRKTLSQP